MNADAQKSGGWDKCDRRAWCNGELKNALPATLQSIFKEMKTVASNGETNGVTVTSNDVWAVPNITEASGQVQANEPGSFQFEYYKNTYTVSRTFWLRAGHYDSMRQGYGFTQVSGTGNALTSSRADAVLPIVAFSCI